MVHFVGAGPGAPDLITLRGAELLKNAGAIIYAGSLVNPALLALAKEDCRIYNSAEMTLEQVIEVIRKENGRGGDIVRLHTGDPCLYGAVREQMDALDALGIPWSARALSSHVWRGARRYRMRNVWKTWRGMARLWPFSCPPECWRKYKPPF